MKFRAHTRVFDGFFTALAFLTRIPIPTVLEKHELAVGLPWFGAVGLVVGFISTLFAFCAVTLASMVIKDPSVFFCLSPMLGAWIWILTEIWLTHGMHWDGLADLGDALGSHATGEKFCSILRDSRIGSFGAICLIVIILGQWLLVSCHFALMLPSSPLELSGWRLAQAGILILAPGWARLSISWLAYVPAHAHSTLGREVCTSLTPGLRRGAMFLGFACICASLGLGATLPGGLMLVLAQLLLIRYLARQARRHGGLSGDFFGAAIVLSQTLFLLLTIG